MLAVAAGWLIAEGLARAAAVPTWGRSLEGVTEECAG